MLTEQDRGAYTPQSDAPLAFDARKASSGGGSSSVTLFLSVIVLLIALAVVLLVYRHGVRHGSQAPQVIGAPVGATKAPPNEAQPADQSAGLQVYKTEVPPPAETGPTPTFTAPPEQPQPIPAPKAPAPSPVAPVATAPLRPAQQPAAVSPAPVKPATAPEETIAEAASASGATQKPPIKLAATAVRPTPLHAASVPAAPVAKPATKVKSAEAPTTPAPAPAAGGPAMVQIGAFSSQALADKGWRDVGAALPGQLAGKSKKVEPVSKNGGTFYRTSVAGFAAHADAVRFCEALKAAGKTCFVK